MRINHPIFNDSIPVKQVGDCLLYEYVMGGETSSTLIYQDDKGLMVAFDLCNFGEFHATISGTEFNGLLLNTYLEGSASRENNLFKCNRMVGEGLLFRPWTSKIDYRSYVDHSFAIGIIILLDEFELLGYEGHTRDVLDRIKSRYQPDAPFQFKISDVSLAYCYALTDALYRNQLSDNIKVRELVTGLLLHMYPNEPIPLTPEPCEDHIVADRICTEMLHRARYECDLEHIYQKHDVDKYKANRLFKSRYGDTPYSFLKRHRLCMAAGEILLGKTSMSEIANDVGYKSESKFAIEFRKQFGVRPKHFRDVVLERQKTLFSSSP